MSIFSRFRSTAIHALLLWSLPAGLAFAEGWNGVVLSAAGPSGVATPVAVREGAEAVTALRGALRALPKQPVGSPAWRFDLVRDGARIDSLALSEAEVNQLGEAASPLLRAMRGQPGPFLYRAELPAAALERLEALEQQLAAAGIRSFQPSAARDSWSSYSFTLAAYQASDPGPGTPAAAPAANDAGRAGFEQQLRSLLQPRPLNAQEERLFQRLLPELYVQYRDLTGNPALRELHVEYERQRWQTAADRRNLLIQVRYAVRTPRELDAIESYLQQRGAPRGTSQRPQSVTLQLIAADADPAAVQQKLVALVPGAGPVRAGH